MKHFSVPWNSTTCTIPGSWDVSTADIGKRKAHLII